MLFMYDPESRVIMVSRAGKAFRIDLREMDRAHNGREEPVAAKDGDGMIPAPDTYSIDIDPESD